MSKPITEEEWKDIVASHEKGELEFGEACDMANILFDEVKRLRDVNERLTTTIREAAGKFKTAHEIKSSSIRSDFVNAGMARIVQAADEMAPDTSTPLLPGYESQEEQD